MKNQRNRKDRYRQPNTDNGETIFKIKISSERSRFAREFFQFLWIVVGVICLLVLFSVIKVSICKIYTPEKTIKQCFGSDWGL